MVRGPPINLASSLTLKIVINLILSMSSQGADHDINFDSHQVESYDENNESRNVAMTFNSTNSMNPIFVMESDGEDAATVVSPRTLEEPITEKNPQTLNPIKNCLKKVVFGQKGSIFSQSLSELNKSLIL